MKTTNNTMVGRGVLDAPRALVGRVVPNAPRRLKDKPPHHRAASAIFAALLCAMASLPSLADAKSATLKVAGYYGEAISGFPALVKLSATKSSDAYGFSHSDCAAQDGSDLWFADSDGNLIPHDVDTWNVAGDSYVWVRIPALTNNAEIVMHWGEARTAEQTCAPADTWAGYVGVWHMNETGTTAEPDMTANGLDAAPIDNGSASTAINTTTGTVGAGRAIASDGTYFSVGSSSSPYHSTITTKANFSVCGWCKLSGIPDGNNYQRIFCGMSSSSLNSWDVWREHATQINVRSGDGSGNDTGGYGAAIAAGDTWHYLTIAWEGNTAKVYENGALLASRTLRANTHPNSVFTIGGRVGTEKRSFVGTFDEVRMYDGALSAARVAADYATMNDPTSFLVLHTGKERTATWTGAAGGGDISNPANWSLKVGDDPAPDAETLPTAEYTVLVSGANVNMQVPSGTTLACAAVKIQDCTFTADCDWRGLSVTPSIVGAADLNGHNLHLTRLAAGVGSSFANGAAGTTNEVRFTASDASYASFGESLFIDGIANLSMAGNVRMAILKDGGEPFTSSGFSLGNQPFEVDFVHSDGAANHAGASIGISGHRGAYRMSGGSLKATSAFEVGPDGEGEFVQTGGNVTLQNWFNLGRRANGNGTYTITGGKLLVNKASNSGADKVYLACASNSKGTLNVGGNGEVELRCGLSVGAQLDSNGGKGYVNVYGNGYLLTTGDNLIGQTAGETGEFKVTGGVAQCNSVTRICNDDNSSGLLDASGAGEYRAIGGMVVGAKGVLRVRAGGRLVAKSVSTSKSTAKVQFDGGTVVATNVADGATLLSNFSSIEVGEGGLALDTAGWNVAMTNCGFASAHGGVFVKAGDGTLTVDVLPQVDKVAVSNGTLEVKSAAAPGEVVVPGLLHRWSFNGATDEENLADAVGGAVGAKIGEAVTFENGEAVMSGDGNSAGSLNLGTGLLGTGEGATIEIWATRTGVKSNARVFDYGSDENNFFMLAWNTASEGEINFRVRKNGGNHLGHNGGVPWTTGEKCHVFVTFKTRDDGSGKPRIGWFAYDPATGRRLNADEFDINSADLTLADLANANFYLGHSQFADHDDANARYDEVRIWDGVLSQSAMARSVELGPNATAAQLAGVGQISASGDTALAVAPGATFDLSSGVSLSRAVVSGGGRVTGGTLTATGELRAKLGECLVVDGGTFDIYGAKVVFSAEDLATLETSRKSYTLARAANGGRIVGSPLQPATDDALPTGWHVVATSGSVTLFKGGMTLFLR